MFSQKELEDQINDKRKPKSLRQLRPDERVAGKELARLVAKRTGYQVKQTTEIIDAFYMIVFELLQKKIQVMIPKVGTIMPRLAKARIGTNFNRGTGKPPEKIIMQPKHCIEFIANKNMVAIMKDLPVTKQDIENLYT